MDTGVDQRFFFESHCIRLKTLGVNYLYEYGVRYRIGYVALIAYSIKLAQPKTGLA